MNEKVKVVINGEVKIVDADQMKLARTIWNKSGTKYTEKEMWRMGFIKKSEDEE